MATVFVFSPCPVIIIDYITQIVLKTCLKNCWTWANNTIYTQVLFFCMHREKDQAPTRWQVGNIVDTLDTFTYGCSLISKEPYTLGLGCNT